MLYSFLERHDVIFFLFNVFLPSNISSSRNFVIIISKLTYFLNYFETKEFFFFLLK